MKPAKSLTATAQTRAYEEARDVAEHMPLVHQTVARFLRKLPRSVLRDDLVAAGTFGLLDALRRCTADARGPAFEWYARVRIRGAIVDELRTQDWLSRRARTRVTADAEGSNPASGVMRTVVGFDDLPVDVQLRELTDATAEDPLSIVENRMQNAALAGVVDSLPERERGIVRSYYFEGVPFKTIAATLGVSEPRVSQLHARAMQMLKAKLDGAAAAEAVA
jgi:RNA polymerase sigma factor for flagellar operon FliA